MQDMSNRHPAGALLFVRTRDALPSAITAVNALLAQRRAVGAAHERLVGIVVHRSVDAVVDTSHRAASDEQGAAEAPPVRLREAAGVAGLWSLCWFEPVLVNGHDEPSALRERLFDVAVAGAGHADAAGRDPPQLIPVFTRAETREDLHDHIQQLHSRYPTLAVGRVCFVHEAAAEPSLVLREAGHATP